MAKNNNDTIKNVFCSFCGKPQASVRKIVAGPGVYICDECISLCNAVLEEEGILDEAEERYTLTEENNMPNPKEIKAFLDAVNLGKAPMWDFEKDYELLKIIDEIES